MISITKLMSMFNILVLLTCVAAALIFANLFATNMTELYLVTGVYSLLGLELALTL